MRAKRAWRLTHPYRPEFIDADKARVWLEARLWKNGAICPHCGVVGEATQLKGKAHRPGVYQCNACREQFTATVGTLYERSKILLNKWLAATHLMMASKKGISANQIDRMLGVSKSRRGSSATASVRAFAKRSPTCSAAKVRPLKRTKPT